jgi:colanic acid/amylovoran biosynthesis glycosyltransferase
MKLAYVVNTYPRPSHSFIRREIRALEAAGHTVQRIAMRADAAPLVDPDDRDEASRTFRVLDQGGAALAAAALACALRHPARMVRALLLAWAGGQAGQGRVPGTGGRLRHLIYLAEAAVVARRAQGADHIHAHFGTNSATVAMLAGVLAGLPYSFTVHGPEEFDAPRALALGLKARHAAFTVAISSFGRSQLMRWTGAQDWPRLHVVPCGIDPARFARPAPLPPGSGRMVAVGRFSEQKGMLLLVQALALAVPRAPGLHLTLVGDGELRGAIEAEIARHGLAAHVRLTGWLDEAGVRAALAGAHALVLPSFAEGLPMVVMEAMAAARLVLTPAIAGVPELVVPGETGWLVPAGDGAALADAMVALAEAPQERLSAMGAAGRARVLVRHDITASAATLAGLFARGA